MTSNIPLGPDRWPVDRITGELRESDVRVDEWVGQVFGQYRLVSPWGDYVGARHKRQLYVRVECIRCERREFVNWLKLRFSKLNSCISCTKKNNIYYPRWLWVRCSMWKQRIEGSGEWTAGAYTQDLKFGFDNVPDACKWIVSNLGNVATRKHLYLRLIDPTKDFAPGNIRWSENPHHIRHNGESGDDKTESSD